MAARKSIDNLRKWIIEVYEDTAKYEDIAFDALNSTVQTSGWENFLVITVINIATAIINAAAVASGNPLVVPAMTFLSSEIQLWTKSGGKPSNLPDVFVEYALSHLKMQEAMEAQLAHYLDTKNDYENLKKAWNKTFQAQGVTYKVSDLAEPTHAFPGKGDTWSALKATATKEFQKRLWNLIIMKTCSYYGYGGFFSAETGPGAIEDLADYVRNQIYGPHPGVYARRNFTTTYDDTDEFEIKYWTLGLGGNEFPKAVCDILFMDDTLGHIIRPDALFHRDYVFKQFATTKPQLHQREENWQEIPSGDSDWTFTGGHFPELTT